MKGLRRFISRWQNALALAIVCAYTILALAAPRLSPPDAVNYNLPPGFRRVPEASGMTPLPPSDYALLGTVSIGGSLNHVDIFHTLLWGARSALVFGVSTVLVTAAFGVFVGAFSGYFGGIVQSVAMRITDAFLTIPIVVGVVFFQQVLAMLMGQVNLEVIIVNGTPQSIGRLTPNQSILTQVDPVMLAMILFSWMPYARITNAMVQRLKGMDFVAAARALGASPLHITLRHLIPNSLSPAVVLAARDIGGLVLLQATFTFIGVGGQSPWGMLLAYGRRWIIAPGGDLLRWWWVFIPATLALILFGVGWNLLGDGINDWMNPRQNQ